MVFKEYTDWKNKMEDLLIFRELSEPIDTKEVPIATLESKWKIVNGKAVATIRQCIDVSVLQHVANVQMPMTCVISSLVCMKGKMLSTKLP